MDNEIKLTSSMEDYLEAILLLERKHRVARIKEISNKLNVTMPSVTGAMRHLRDQGFIEYEKNSYINLTQKGKILAECILERHNTLMRFLKECLKLEGEWVERQACKLEHAINHETAKRLSNLTEWVNRTAFQEMEISNSEWVKMLHKN